eukprot:2859175-Rhodomonas_salina.1
MPNTDTVPQQKARLTEQGNILSSLSTLLPPLGKPVQPWGSSAAPNYLDHSTPLQPLSKRQEQGHEGQESQATQFTALTP